MFPMFELFGKDIGLYTLMAIAGYLLAGAWACRTAQKRGHDDNNMILLLLVIAVGVFIGGHMLFGLLNLPLWPQLANNLQQGGNIKDFFTQFYVIFGGMVFYGGLIGGGIAGLLCVYKMRLPLPEYADILAPAIPLFHTFGRIGCFLGGCCYGVESSVGFIYTQALVAGANGVRRFPIQLTEAAGNFLLFLLLAALLRKKALPGWLLPVYLLVYAAMRFVFEFWRGDQVRGFVFSLSTSQFISLLLFVGAGIFLLCNFLLYKASNINGR